MEKNNDIIKGAGRLILLFLSIVWVLMTAATAFTANAAGDGDLQITEKLTVTSKVKNVLSQTYDSAFGGKIKNVSAEALSDITLTVSVKTKTLNQTGSFTITIPQIAAGKVYSINSTAESEANFEEITAVTARIGNGAEFTLSNATSTNPANNATPAILGAAGGVIILVIVLLIVVRVRRNGNNYNRQIQSQSQTQNQNIVVNVVAPAPQPAEALTACRYCGAKNPASAPSCSNCGAILK
ncbi:MAG: zinc ribbon domain-containing protein [Clostridiales bacterium]|jgi:flagellar biogenesis protein FliO|nr:zinc ribbon domain-containing protein [Clostridiales bacterium]